ncbi:MAG: chromosome segregation protein SMC [Heliobacteriaceae bacterium]|jgi:chromosome segregation protein|nr:chromosome segregation protein SMC [Heliobacteriaceae bacterium]
MYIKQLEIDNFKSFANKSEIPLLQGFTTVSGPNGSGKSNIIDSILFALGLANAGELRAENLSHFISTYTKRNEAFVKVTFGGVEGMGELKIARKIRKTNQGYASTYYLNDSVTTLSNIHAVLEEFNVTPNSYNVMMQGDVMGITNCSAKNRRKIIDEIAGIADFDRRIEQATNELTTVEQRVEKSVVILNEVDLRLEQLKEERETALKYQKLREEKNELESQVNKVRFFDLKRNLEQAHANILEFGKKKKEEELKNKDLDERLTLIKTKYQEISEKVKEQGEEQQIELKKQEEAIKGETDRKNNAANYADKQIHDGLRSIENAKNGIEGFAKKIEDFKLKISMKDDETAKIKAGIQEKEAELNKILQDMTGLNATADQHIEKRAKLRQELESLQDKENSLIKEKLLPENELKNLQGELERAKVKLEELSGLKTNFASDYDLKKTLTAQLQQELEDFKIIQQNTLHDLDKTKNEINDLNYNIRTASNKISSMEARKQMSEEANFGRAVDTVTGAKLKGVHAPLVQLGTVSKEYATAMEVAFGSRMTHIVVDDEHVASVAIELLKSSGAGRATFIPLNKVRPAPAKLLLPKDKGVIDFAINLVDFEPDYTNAFYYAVGETLVVKDMDCAKKLIGKYRMVTLQGEIFEKSGSMTGGSVRKSGLSFSQNDDNELNDYRSRLEEMELKLNALETKKSESEKKLETVRTNYSESMSEFSKSKVELENMKKNYENSEIVLKECTEFIKAAEPKVTALNKKLDKLEEQNIKIADNMAIVQERITEVEKLLQEQDLKDLKEKTEGVEFEIKRLQANLMNAGNDKNELERQIAFHKNLIETKNEEIVNIENNNKKLEEDKVQYKNDIVELNKKLENLQKQIDEIEVKLGKLLKERDEINADLIDLETQKHIRIADIERIEEQIESFKARRRELEPQLDTARQELADAGIELDKLEPVNISVDEINAKIQRLEKRMNELGDVNMRALAAYEEVLKRQNELKEQIETLSKERKEILGRMQGYEQLKKETFMKTFNNINENFKEVFHKLSEGEGELKLETPDDPLSGGMTIEAQPRDKKLQRLESMSGGEKSLTALAFVFAIQKYMPSPFYAFDEVDANLDTMNVERIAHMVQNQAKDTQFIVVSHRKPMIESANRTIGVTQKEKGITKVTGIKLRD